jgi:hypothetical protein
MCCYAGAAQVGVLQVLGVPDATIVPSVCVAQSSLLEADVLGCCTCKQPELPTVSCVNTTYQRMPVRCSCSSCRTS